MAEQSTEQITEELDAITKVRVFVLLGLLPCAVCQLEDAKVKAMNEEYAAGKQQIINAAKLAIRWALRRVSYPLELFHWCAGTSSRRRLSPWLVTDLLSSLAGSVPLQISYPGREIGRPSSMKVVLSLFYFPSLLAFVRCQRSEYVP